MNNRNNVAEVKTVFSISEDGTIRPKQLIHGNITDRIPTAIYRIGVQTTMTSVEYFLAPSEFPGPPKKIYGDIHSNVTRYFSTFEKRNENLGICLIGQKGSGKTTTARVMVKTAIAMDMPVIIIDDKLNMSILSRMFALITQPIAVFFDEFDKLYRIIDNDNNDLRNDNQDKLLTILDGSNGGGKKMFVIIANDAMQISPYLKNRPGRIRYTTGYDLLPNEVIAGYMRDKIKDCPDDKIMEMISIKYTSAGALSFDMMAAVIEESQTYGESLIEATKFITGQKIFHDYYILYGVGWSVIDVDENGIPRTIPDLQIYPSASHAFIKSGKIQLSLVKSDKLIDPATAEYVTLDKEDLVSMSPDFKHRCYKKNNMLFHVSPEPSIRAASPNKPLDPLPPEA